MARLPVRPPVDQDAWGSDDEQHELEQRYQSSLAWDGGTQQRQHQHRQQQQQQYILQTSQVLSQLLQPITVLSNAGSIRCSSSSSSNIRQCVMPAGSSPAACQRADSLLTLEHYHQHQQQQQQLPSLCKICLGVLGRYVTELVEQLDGQLGFLAPDIKAALLAVAR
jgi:hypothetical protein